MWSENRQNPSHPQDFSAVWRFSKISDFCSILKPLETSKSSSRLSGVHILRLQALQHKHRFLIDFFEPNMNFKTLPKWGPRGSKIDKKTMSKLIFFCMPSKSNCWVFWVQHGPKLVSNRDPKSEHRTGFWKSFWASCGSWGPRPSKMWFWVIFDWFSIDFGWFSIDFGGFLMDFLWIFKHFLNNVW